MKMCGNNRGVTLVELIAAMAISAVVLSLVFYSWQGFESYFIKNNQRSQFLAEVDRIAQGVTGSILRSPQVLRWDDHRIVLRGSREIDPDTLEYRVIDSILCCNGKPLTTTVNSLRMYGFDLAMAEGKTVANDGALFDIVFTARDGFGNETSIMRKAFVQDITENK